MARKKKVEKKEEEKKSSGVVGGVDGEGKLSCVEYTQERMPGIVGEPPRPKA